MVWAHLDDQFPEHPKVIAAGGDAAWLYVAALCWSRRQLSKGSVPKTILPRLTDRKRVEHLAAKLVDVGLWIDHGDHYEINDYEDWNGSEDEARERRRERASKASRARWGDARSNAQASAKHKPEDEREEAASTPPSTARGHAPVMPHARGGARGPYPSLNPSAVVQPLTRGAEGESDEDEGPRQSNGTAPTSPYPPDWPTDADGLPVAAGADHPELWFVERTDAERVALTNVAQRIGWTSPLRRTQLAGEWDHGLTLLDRRVLEDVLVRCDGARSTSYLRTAVVAAAREAGVPVPIKRPPEPSLAAALTAEADDARY